MQSLVQQPTLMYLLCSLSGHCQCQKNIYRAHATYGFTVFLFIATVLPNQSMPGTQAKAGCHKDLVLRGMYLRSRTPVSRTVRGCQPISLAQTEPGEQPALPLTSDISPPAPLSFVQASSLLRRLLPVRGCILQTDACPPRQGWLQSAGWQVAALG